jgi:spore maturation protein CgeB
VPAVTSHLVPFATKYLLGKTRDDLSLDEPGDKVVSGDGAIVVQADNVDKFTEALTTLLMDEDLCKGMGESAYQITIPYFTWEIRTRAFLEEIGMVSPDGE